MKIAIVYSSTYLEHDPGVWHPESPRRLLAIIEELKKENLWENVVEPRPAEIGEILSVHDRSYVELLEEIARYQIPLDSDTPTRENTFEVALFAAGGAVCAGHLVLNGEAECAFALVRPPGHHASRSAGGGFCYLNNIAVMTKSLLNEIKRVLIFDFDAHHGNGTQDIFYSDPNVLYISIHQYPLYPGTGRIEEIGENEGEGFTINIPVPPGTGDGEYAAIIEDVVVPITEQFGPDIIALSAGFDAHSRDPLTQLELSSDFYGWMTRKIFETAERICDGKVVFVLEGGYDLKALAESVANVLKAARGDQFSEPQRKKVKVIEELRNILAGKWKI